MITTNRYTVTATSISPLRIGGKEDPLSEADNPVAVVGGRICLPGPSLKGALRGEIERHLNDTFYDRSGKRWLTDKLPFQPCIPSAKLSRDEQRLVREGRYRARACRYPDGGDGICPACYILGAQGLVGFASIPFLFTDVGYDELYSARLERTSRTVMQGTNRSYQLVPPDTKFLGILQILISDDLLGWRLGRSRALEESAKGDAWLAGGEWSSEKIIAEFVLNRIQAIQNLGGYRSKGFGNVEISIEQKSESKAQAAPQ